MDKKLLMILIMGMFMISLVSAFEFDNIKSYDEEIKTVIIENAFGLGEDIVSATLNTPQIYQVRIGEKVKIARFTINPYEDYENLLGGIEINDLKDDGKEIK